MNLNWPPPCSRCRKEATKRSLRQPSKSTAYYRAGQRGIASPERLDALALRAENLLPLFPERRPRGQ